MKKNTTIWLTSAALFSTLLATGQARDVSLKIDKENRNAVTILHQEVVHRAPRRSVDEGAVHENDGWSHWTGTHTSPFPPT